MAVDDVAIVREVLIPAGHARLPGLLAVPHGAVCTVVFAHGSGSGRLSPRNRAVAHALNESGLATLLMDLLTEHEAADRRNVFDIPLLASRLRAAAAWLRAQAHPALSPAIGYFGARTGAAAALVAAADDPAIAAVVSRGGRPDLAGPHALAAVRAPTLLIVGELDTDVLDLNRRASDAMRCPRAIAVVPGAGHLFEEPGALEQVARLSRDWFTRHRGPPAPPGLSTRS